MNVYILQSLNIFFFVFHSTLILFNVLGWIVPKWRLLNFISLSITAFSWFGLGIWYGWGYCFCTDWHWQVLKLLGVNEVSNSYIHFLVLKLTGINLPVNAVDLGTIIIFVLSFTTSAFLNFKKIKSK